MYNKVSMKNGCADNLDFRCFFDEAISILDGIRDCIFVALLRSFDSESVAKGRESFCRDVQTYLSDKRSLESKRKKLRERLGYENKQIQRRKTDGQEVAVDVMTTKRLLKQPEMKIRVLKAADASTGSGDVVVDKSILERWMSWTKEMKAKCLACAEGLEKMASSKDFNGKPKVFLKDVNCRMRESASYYSILRMDVVKLCEQTKVSCVRAVKSGRRGRESIIRDEYVHGANVLLSDYRTFVNNQKKFADEFRRSVQRLGIA